MDEREAQRRVEQAYDLLAGDPEEADVEGLMIVQAEALLHD